MTIIRASAESLGPQNKPDWLQTTVAGLWSLAAQDGEHDLHYHDYNQLYLIARGRAMVLNGGCEEYVQKGDVVCIRAGDERDILEVYDDEDLVLWFLYEGRPAVENARLGHLH